MNATFLYDASGAQKGGSYIIGLSYRICQQHALMTHPTKVSASSLRCMERWVMPPSGCALPLLIHASSCPQQARGIWLLHPEQLRRPICSMQGLSNQPTSTNLLLTVRQLGCVSRCMSTSSNNTTSHPSRVRHPSMKQTCCGPSMATALTMTCPDFSIENYIRR